MDRVPEQRFAAEGGYHFGHDTHGRQNQDVDLGVAEEPEQVLPQDRVAAGGGIEEVGAELPVGGKFDEGHGDDGEGQHQQDAGNQGHPHEHRHTHQGHSGARILMMVTTNVETGGQRCDAQQLQAERPEVQAFANAERRGGEVSIGEPAGIRNLSNQEAGVHQQRSKQEHPVGKSVETRECHVPGANHQGNHEVKERGSKRHNYHEDHGGAVHGEHGVEPLGGDEGSIRGGQLQTH